MREFSINRTPCTVDDGKNFRVTAGLSGILGLIDIGLEGGKDKHTNRSITEEGRFIGRIIREEQGAVKFKMWENPGQKDGLPTQLRLAVLLERNSTAGDLELSAYVDVHTSWWEDMKEVIQRYFQGTPESRPRVVERAECLDGGDEHIAAEVGKVDLDQLSYVLSTTVLSDLVRTQALGGGGV